MNLSIQEKNLDNLGNMEAVSTDTISVSQPNEEEGDDKTLFAQSSGRSTPYLMDLDDNVLEQTDNASENSEEEQEDPTDEENDFWLKPNVKKPQIQLSLFGQMWTVLDRLITTDTKVLVKNNEKWAEYPNLRLPSDGLLLTRLEILTKKVLTLYVSYFYYVKH